MAALFAASVVLNVWLLHRIRCLDARQKDLMQRIRERTDRRDLATVAVAAVMLTREGQQVGRRDIEEHVEGLLQHWTRIEEMADEISRKLDETVSTGSRR
ncbi:hypothetical protein CKO28_13105 [Rhodovibrio sodomensis]|uniref:Histidine kinase n=1 Tax=Rhodovibrio sodomensis TaxID=1088 RepID=A0ABS1DES3_9PROT|nr:hypothetical protein [Rhodovibrio sodomensis]